jgi:hypothetical protein
MELSKASNVQFLPGTTDLAFPYQVHRIILTAVANIVLVLTTYDESPLEVFGLWPAA